VGDVVDVIEADAVLVVDAAGIIVHANAAAERVTGQTDAALRGLPVATVLAKGTRRIPRVAPRIVVVSRDDCRPSDELERMRAQLLLAERRATLGTLAGGVGHELRNIAQIQVACVTEIETALAADPEGGGAFAALVRELLPDLKRVGEHVVAHGGRLLSLARPTPDTATAVELTELVIEVVAMLRSAGKLRAIQIELGLPEPITVIVNRTRIEQVLFNLLINAIDAIAAVGPPASGQLAGTIAIRVVASADGTRAICSVHDTGCGIAAEDIDRIWEPFFTTKPADRGTGLGLSIARELVASYGGTLTVASTSGDGTTFTFELPCVRQR
jgi:two-component system NtrC family sensor kinase